ncbi:MAG: hypothetical protein M5R41_10925 [Bacteroidia bacterium]|nr:hypothetical protein [Bacteroidia bacterium]
MRNFSLLFITLSAVLLAACGSGNNGDALRDDPPTVKVYAVKNVKIEYEYSGAAKGSKTHLIANYGMYQRMEDDLTYTLGGNERTVSIIDIIADTVQYHIDKTKNSGTRTSFEVARLEKLVDGYSPQELKDFQASYLLKSGAKVIGKETILGKECTVYDLAMSGVVVSLWNSVTMRSKIKMGDSEIIMTAVDIDESFSPDADMFAPPKDAKIEEPRIISNFPEGHPPVDGPSDSQMPEGHPPVDAPGGSALPEGHPPVDAPSGAQR